ncbi:MAG TPA: DUF2188 domain-containing protein [Flavobacteriaceae bacterium]|nr:DUF2188 domain-containing protein [Flavobacteriaceae bacterium]
MNNQKSEVVIHGRNGKIRDKDSYTIQKFLIRDFSGNLCLFYQ